jgi:hypothetical protein
VKSNYILAYWYIITFGTKFAKSKWLQTFRNPPIVEIRIMSRLEERWYHERMYRISVGRVKWNQIQRAATAAIVAAPRPRTPL